MQTTSSNDLVFYLKDSKVVSFDASSVSPEVVLFEVEEHCKVVKARENEAANTIKPTDAIFSVQCFKYTQIVNGVGEQLFRAEQGDNAPVKKIFAKTGSKQFIRMLADLQLQYVSEGAILWKREEALSQIRQVEVFDQSNINKDII